MDNMFTMEYYKRNISVDSDTDMSGDECTDTIQDIVYVADKEDRLIKGIFESAHILEMCPDIVDVCILPSGACQSTTTRIQHKLIAAYCWENDIQIVELVDFNDIFKALRSKSANTGDIECVLITSKPFENDVETDEVEGDVDENFG